MMHTVSPHLHQDITQPLLTHHILSHSLCNIVSSLFLFSRFNVLFFSNITAEHQPAVARTDSAWVPVKVTGNILTQLPGGAVCSHLKGRRKSEGCPPPSPPSPLSLPVSLSQSFLRVLKITCWGKTADGKAFRAAPRRDITALRQL